MTVELKVPEVGESVTEVYIGEWRKKEGEHVRQDEEVVELESEKATFDAPAPAAGVITKILKQSGESAEVGEVIAHIDENAEADSEDSQGDTREKKSDDPQGGKPDSGKDGGDGKKAGKKESRADEQPAQSDSRDGEPRVMPAAKRLLAQNDLDANDVEGTGPGGRVLKEDVERHLEQADGRSGKSSQPADEPGRQTESVLMSPLRRRIAERLVEAQKNAALLTTFNEIDMTAVKQLRQEHKDAFQKKHGIKLGFMSFFIKAAIDALKQCPQLNASIDGNQIVYHNYFDVGVAIGTEKGLVVPVLRNAERMSFAEIELAIDDFATRAQDGRLSIEELLGGTFTISNGGIYGSLLSTPIVNPPQSGVLGMHAIQDRPVARDGQVVIRPMMYVALSYDHRIVDGREAVTFLKRIAENVEEPARMLLEI